MIIALIPGQHIAPIREITRQRIAGFRFANECTYMGSGIMPGTALRVVETNKVAGNMWVKVELPHTDPPALLKISGEEFAHNFKSE